MPIGKRCFFLKLLVLPYPYFLRDKLNWDVTQSEKKTARAGSIFFPPIFDFATRSFL